MNKKIELGIAAMLLIGVLAFKFLSGGKKEPVKEIEYEENDDNLPADVKSKNEIMSELGKKGAAASAKVRKAKAAAKKAEKEALLNDVPA